MDVLPATPTTIARDALTPQPQANTGHGGPPPQALPLETVAAVLSPAQATLLKVLSEAIQNATATQGGLAALLPDLVQAQSTPVLPPTVRAAIAGVLTATADLQAFPTDNEITAAFLKPAVAAAVAVSASTPLPVTPTEVRVALQSLQQAVQQWEPEAGTPAIAPTNAQPTPTTPQAATSLPQSVIDVAIRASLQAPVASTASVAQPSAGQPALLTASASPTPPVLTPPAVTPQQGIPVAQSATPAVATAAAMQAQALPPAAEFGDAVASLMMLQQSAKAVTQAALKPKPPTTRNGDVAPSGRDALAPERAALAAAKSQAPSLAPISAVTRWPTNPDAAFVARTLATRTENALTQFKLLEAANQMQHADDRPVTTNTNEPRWAFDIPFQAPQGQSTARFEIDRDTYKARNGQLSRVWRVRFSLDVEPLGPVHAQIALMGKNAWVSIMAEREATMRTLESQQQALLKGLGAEDLSAEVICGVGKAPHHEEQDKAGKLLDSAI